MSTTPPPLPAAVRARAMMKNLLFIGLLAGLIGYAISQLWKPEPAPPVSFVDDDAAAVSRKVDAAFVADWNEKKIQPLAPADDLAVMRRLGLALTGSGPSVEEIRHFEKQPENRRIEWWVSRLLHDRRSSAYLAERFARIFVGVENGPFIVYRRHRMVRWLDDQIFENKPYNDLVHNLIAAEGLWTTHPEANFITVSIDQNNQKNGPDEVKLAARTTRAFLGVRIDCMQCHDDMFGDHWKQKDFHQLAAFFSQAKMGITGVQEDPKLEYATRFRGESKEEPVSAAVPFSPELLPKDGNLRQRLATWTTHDDNSAFARTAVNRVWALMFNQPLHFPVDNIPLEGPYPPGMEILATDFVENGYDLQRLVRIIASTNVFQIESRSTDPANPVTEEHEQNWAAFPMTRLRPEQVADSVIQSSTLSPLDADSHIISRMREFFETNDFIKRYGDLGEDEFGEQAGTIPQRLVMMNGKLVRERTKENPVMNASTRIAGLTKDHNIAIETAYLAVFSRRPSSEENDHFVSEFEGKYGSDRSRAMQDLYWALINSTEFTWNH
ncbi:MAG: DUF1549 domain-containing protein [Verrucomicrobiales bacterium]